MKQYYITTQYVQGTQVSIQQDHASKKIMSDIMNERGYKNKNLFNKYMEDETTISLSVGQPNELLQLHSFMQTHEKSLNIPFAIFQEPSMNYTPTCLTFIATDKLCVYLKSAVDGMLRAKSLRSLYRITEDFSYQCPRSGINIDVLINDGKNFLFDVSYDQQDMIDYQNHEMLDINVEDPDVIKANYERLNNQDFAHYAGESFNDHVNTKKVSWQYNLAELNFLLMINSLRLK